MLFFSQSNSMATIFNLQGCRHLIDRSLVFTILDPPDNRWCNGFVYNFLVLKNGSNKSSIMSNLIETPKFNLNLDCVYQPAEDTFLFLDALQKDLNLIKHLKLVHLITRFNCV